MARADLQAIALREGRPRRLPDAALAALSEAAGSGRSSLRTVGRMLDRAERIVHRPVLH
jgi:hypothetical protein